MGSAEYNTYGMAAAAYEAAVKIAIEDGDYGQAHFIVQEMLACVEYEMYYCNQTV